MIISPGRRYIFVHIPKTGGTSLARALEGRAMRDDILIGDTPKALRRRRRLKGARARGRLWKHSTLSDIEGLVTPEFIAGAFTVTLVRNPWDRMVSYYHWLRAQDFDHPAVALARGESFAGFLGAAHTRASIRANPYTAYMTTSEGVERCSAYLRLEHFEQDAEALWRHLGFRLSLPHDNASSRRKDYRAYYTDSDAALLAELCASDIARFSYRF